MPETARGLELQDGDVLLMVGTAIRERLPPVVCVKAAVVGEARR